MQPTNQAGGCVLLLTGSATSPPCCLKSLERLVSSTWTRPPSCLWSANKPINTAALRSGVTGGHVTAALDAFSLLWIARNRAATASRVSLQLILSSSSVAAGASEAIVLCCTARHEVPKRVFVSSVSCWCHKVCRSILCHRRWQMTQHFSFASRQLHGVCVTEMSGRVV